MTWLWDWAVMWSIPPEAVQDLERRLGMSTAPTAKPPVALFNEATVQAKVRLEASRRGIFLWRNNVGALKDETGRFVRYGLANDSALVNEKVKSADLIGIRPHLVTTADVGRTIGQFVSRECKAPGWKYAGTDREEAQLKWLQIVTAAGGDAAFTTGEGSF